MKNCKPYSEPPTMWKDNNRGPTGPKNVELKKKLYLLSISVNGYKRTMQQIKVSFVSHIKVKHQTKTNCF